LIINNEQNHSTKGELLMDNDKYYRKIVIRTLLFRSYLKSELEILDMIHDDKIKEQFLTMLAGRIKIIADYFITLIISDTTIAEQKEIEIVAASIKSVFGYELAVIVNKNESNPDWKSTAEILNCIKEDLFPKFPKKEKEQIIV
jgi:hypothetical protein